MKKSRIIAGWEIDFRDPVQLTKILMTHGVDAYGFEFFRYYQTATELVIEEDKIVEVISHSRFLRQKMEMDAMLPVKEWLDRPIFFLTKDEKGIHTIGGPKPPSFVLPHHEALKSNFIYIGALDTSDPKFQWINLEKLHLTYPVYEGAFEVFLDYQDPNAPVILNPETFIYSWMDDEVKGVEKVQYTSQNYKVVDEIDFEEFEKDSKNDLLCGVPLWYQYPDIPTCPKNGKVMQFVATINSDFGLKVENEDEVKNIPFGNYLVFGDEGHLFVFYEPESKTLCMIVQF